MSQKSYKKADLLAMTDEQAEALTDYWQKKRAMYLQKQEDAQLGQPEKQEKPKKETVQKIHNEGVTLPSIDQDNLDDEYETIYIDSSQTDAVPRIVKGVRRYYQQVKVGDFEGELECDKPIRVPKFVADGLKTFLARQARKR